MSQIHNEPSMTTVTSRAQEDIMSSIPEVVHDDSFPKPDDCDEKTTSDHDLEQAVVGNEDSFYVCAIFPRSCQPSSEPDIVPCCV